MAKEESQRVRDVYELVRRARASMPAEEMASAMAGGVNTAVNLLMKAVERAVGPENYPGGATVIFPFAEEDTLDEYGPGQREEVERIFANIRGESEHTFVISFHDIELSVEDIWPEGDAPENPTPEDVIEVMKQSEFAHPMTIAAEWLLIESLFVRSSHDEEGAEEVEWDGT